MAPNPFRWLVNSFVSLWLAIFSRSSKSLRITGSEQASSAIPEWTPPPTATEDLEWADLISIDLSQASTAAGRRTLAKQMLEAMTTQGFFYAINHGYTAEQTRRVFSLANATFDCVSKEEKEKYTVDDQKAEAYEGYKPRNVWQIEPGVYDSIEQYNINRKVYNREHPTFLRPYLKELEDFAKHNHFNVVFPILRLLAIGLELPEDALVEQHKFEGVDESSVRFMKYFPRSAEDELKTKNVWLKGHTDIGSVTVLWSQPISGLQILSPDGKWRWVRHVENALVINTGDVINFLSGSYYKPTIHRVTQPPPSQSNLARVGVFYFSMANDDVKLLPHTESPVLQRVGIKDVPENEEGAVLTMNEWRRSRTRLYGRNKTVRKVEGGLDVEEEEIAGVKVTQYN
ncbi:Clavaminate synthase-like protein [Stereum hirsutum FP-91666 SS1]|uniref:Clavaminate synthase-like protein n=1 Tax=Stereum hirsutum (strain FP-91666) TaxID=721885 RepID=UPI0004449D7B|nr:Clavaminate synthase-like protein [Stereum hirsutum FP-91666 SS1]EIM83980.1 Clavaminate synthase-like protein [Stereum hirsutum FP-91666 SS1]